ncbi:uncharacterized protein F4812DRAFT_424020 [Daldinia caldariorum]|uniref:uncharacterized protein n=1 Tax=Daldinia caldariorum TaxID=326644 RepID=UPI002008D033|nr:uncharacterized protein F4812DRAFT_424020 [Daldinia caldariorum]KAI1468663.1 hypothetical protein F4812DRAFT_424020 [Daldinia caldariorum]
MAPIIPPHLAAQARSVLSAARSTAHDLTARTASDLQNLGPLAARSILLARDGDDNSGQEKVDPHKGAVRPQDINNTFVFVLFGLIGAGFVCTGIWFFFWAKNGGFYFKEDDWEDYKSTVLRRKGPNGTILSNATPTTQLGGGSVYKDVDDGRTEYTGGLTQLSAADTGSTLTGITAGASDLAARERRRQKRERKDREREKKKDRRNREKSGRRVGEDGVLVDEQAEAEAKDQLRAYREEKPARVGGINKESEGSTWDGSTNPESSTAGSDLHSNNRHSSRHGGGGSSSSSSGVTETTADGGRHKSGGGGIRKVYSTADRNAEREKRAEARRLREESRASGGSGGAGVKRDYSFQRARAAPHSTAVASSSVMRQNTIEEEPQEMAQQHSMGNRFLPAPGGWTPTEVSAESADTGTKSYHHVIPGLSPSTLSGGGTDVRDYAEDRDRDRERDRDRDRDREKDKKKKRSSRGHRRE